jgi:hypothetical protein
VVYQMFIYSLPARRDPKRDPELNCLLING